MFFDEPLTGLRKLEDGVLDVHLVIALGITAEVLLEHRPDGGLVHAQT